MLGAGTRGRKAQKQDMQDFEWAKSGERRRRTLNVLSSTDYRTILQKSEFSGLMT